MHLLAATAVPLAESREAVDLDQPPGDIVFLSAADGELASIARALKDGKDRPSFRLANQLRLTHPLSVDLYLEKTASKSKLIVARLLGGRGYWPYGVDELSALAHRFNIPLALLPGDDRPDPELFAASTLPSAVLHRLWGYLLNGGASNIQAFLDYAAHLIGKDTTWIEPKTLPPAGLFNKFHANDRPVAALVFYRALVHAGDTAPIETLCQALEARGLNPLPIFVTSLKDPIAAATLESLLAEHQPNIALNLTGFAVSAPGAEEATPFAVVDCPVLQVILSSGDEASWQEGTYGLAARDIAMNVALPEIDGRIITRAISFKAKSEDNIIFHQPLPDRVEFVAELALAWMNLRRAPTHERRIAIILANYPNRDGRLGNGVGLDTPAATVNLLFTLAQAGYLASDIPKDGDELMQRLIAGPTNDLVKNQQRKGGAFLPLSDYSLFLASLPQAVQKAVSERWGTPESDPFYRPGETDCGGFVLSIIEFGRIVIGAQPARGYNVDPKSSAHSPDLVPPHSYLAFYAWLRQNFRAQAIIHMGKHGNLEWLPGKSLALSEECFPEVALGPLPHLYPFIVNDPGEGTQAKRRAQAVIIDHLTPPLTRAESYGPLRDLERLVDEYYEAARGDPRRVAILRKEIVSLASTLGLDEDCGITPGDEEGEALNKLDNHLCELKELQIRDGLHIFGISPEGRQLADLLVALSRVPRGTRTEDQSILRALADDLALGFDPLESDLAAVWQGPTPPLLARQAEGNWRTKGDTIERLEGLALALVEDREIAPGPASKAVLKEIENRLRPAVIACGANEMASLLKGLDGRFVPPGPSGAPTRGRPEVLPTGKNFYSIDSRAVPTPAAWTLGWKSASALIDRHLQEEGDYPSALALSAWGTSNMRTGGDDIAQGLALMGVRPTWENSTGRVTGVEILPLSLLDRPRIDVTLRVSGFFRDAFPNLIELFDRAARAVAALDEPEEMNPLAARVRKETAQGVDPVQAAARVFGSKPGAYGAGLQALIDERCWESEADLAKAYIAWGGYAYGAGGEGKAAHKLFEARLANVDLVVQNQDNREHDLLDSDDYYQFQGGLTAAVRLASGESPTVYHMDHSRPETPRARTLDEEIARVVRARVVNPKWIKGVMRHGYKGGFEMAATVDYLFAFAATARCVKDHHFDAVYQAYLNDDEVREFLERSNPDALNEIAKRLQEAIDRNLWRPRANDTYSHLAELSR
jgi:cobaltochelatase CobN